MARLRASWRTSLPVVQQPRNPQSESIARSPYHYALLRLFGAGEALFQTGWFVESLATQVLVIFAIRTRRRLSRSWPHPLLGALALGIVALAVALPFTPVGRWFGFVAPPPLFFL